MQAPELISGFIIQNANAHRTGFGPLWDATLKFWSEPTKENEAATTVHLTFEFTREQYTGGLPEDVAATIRGEPCVEDWMVMNLPGRMKTQRALIADYANHAPRFDAIAGYLKNGNRLRSCCGAVTTHSSTSPKPYHGRRICRAWKRIFSMAGISCSG